LGKTTGTKGELYYLVLHSQERNSSVVILKRGKRMQECEICGEPTSTLYKLRRQGECLYVCSECLERANGAKDLICEHQIDLREGR